MVQIWERVKEQAAEHRRIVYPALFFLLVLFYHEIVLKLFCFGRVTFSGVLFTWLFSIPMALLLSLFCAWLPPKPGRFVFVGLTGLLSLWFGSQGIYYHLFKTFLTIFSISKMAMVAQSFGSMAMGEIFNNWFPILMFSLPVVLALLLCTKVISGDGWMAKAGICWAGLALLVQGGVMALVLLSGQGLLSTRFIYFRAAAPTLEVQRFGLLTQTQLELARVLFGIHPEEEMDLQSPQHNNTFQPSQEIKLEVDEVLMRYNQMDLDFDQLIKRDRDNEILVDMHQYFSQVEPTKKNQWTGRFQGKNLIWIVAEGYSDLILDPERTPTLWKLSHEGMMFENFYVPLWGVSTSDGEYVATTGLIPKPGIWSYARSAQNWMPFAFGNQFRRLGYRTLAYHDYLYTYYDRNLSHPNMGYEYYGLGNGLQLEEVWPPSDLEMMETIVPQFVTEDSFMVYCLTVSGHLNYTYEDNAMSRRHRDLVDHLPYSEPVRAYLACQMELELAMESLMEQLEAAGRLEDTVIVLSGDHYPYGLTDQEYSELFGHSVDPNFEIFENGLILWSKDLQEPVRVEKYCSSLDLMPTLANLFGLEYDSRLMAGRDIFSDTPGLVIFANYSFLNEKGKYNSTEDRFETWDGSPADPKEVEEMLREVHNRVAYSSLILDHDYYRVVFQGPWPAKEGERIP